MTCLILPIEISTPGHRYKRHAYTCIVCTQYREMVARGWWWHEKGFRGWRHSARSWCVYIYILILWVWWWGWRRSFVVVIHQIYIYMYNLQVRIYVYYMGYINCRWSNANIDRARQLRATPKLQQAASGLKTV